MPAGPHTIETWALLIGPWPIRGAEAGARAGTTLRLLDVSSLPLGVDVSTGCDANALALRPLACRAHTRRPCNM